MEKVEKCACCSKRAGSHFVTYKPGERKHKVPLCGTCFKRYRITGAFLSGCLLNMEMQSAEEPATACSCSGRCEKCRCKREKAA
jgi:hypothetical protein